MVPSQGRGLGESQRLKGKSKSTPTITVKRFLSGDDAAFSPQEASTAHSSFSSTSSSPKAPSCGSTASPKSFVALPSLKAPPMTGANTIAGTTMGSIGIRTIRTSDLLREVAQMRHEEVEFFGGRLGHLPPKDAEKLRRAFRTRAAELLSTATVQQLDSARRTLLVLHSADSDLEFNPWHLSDTWPTTAGADATRWQCPTRAFEERIAHLAHKNVHNLPLLSQCHAVTSDLAPRGFIRAKVHEVVITCILRWVETEPASQLRKHAMLLHELADVEASIMVILERRLVRRSRHAFTAGRLSSFLQLILDLQDRGLAVLDGPGAPVVDMKSATRFAPLQVALLDALRVGLKDWPIRRVAEEFDGIVLKIMTCREQLQDNIRVAATERIYVGLHVIRDMILRRVDPRRVQEEFLHWGSVAVRMGEHELLEFSEPMRIHILSPPDEIGSMAFCAASVTPGAAEIPPEYLGYVNGMYERLEEVWRVVLQVVALIGEDAEVATALKLLAESRLDLPRRSREC